MPTFLYFTLSIAAMLIPVSLHASTMISPHALFMDRESPSAVFYVLNSGLDPTEVTVELEFGYPASDSVGGVHVKLIESPGPEEPSATGWVRALPRRAIVRPGERQAVRLLAQPPKDLPDGEYWSRILVTTLSVPRPREVTEDGRIQVGVTLQTRTIISMNYRTGDVSTSVSLRGFDAKIEDGELVAKVELQREGNAAYLGSMELVLTNDQDVIVGRWERAVAVYHNLFRRLTFPLEGLPSGQYQLKLHLSTDRKDIPTESILPARTIEARVDVGVS